MRRPARGRTKRRSTGAPVSEAPQYPHSRTSSGFCLPHVLQYIPLLLFCRHFGLLIFTQSVDAETARNPPLSTCCVLVSAQCPCQSNSLANFSRQSFDTDVTCASSPLD